MNIKKTFDEKYQDDVLELANNMVDLTDNILYGVILDAILCMVKEFGLTDKIDSEYRELFYSRLEEITEEIKKKV